VNETSPFEANIVAATLLVAILDSVQVARDTYAAVLHIELGLDFVAAASVSDLLAGLRQRIPNLLVVGEDHPEPQGGLGAIEALNASFPSVPLIAIGRHYPSLGADSVLESPVDAVELIALARSLLSV
jgi:hypothetical protein